MNPAKRKYTYACCAHCVIEEETGACWASVEGHYAYCLMCQTHESGL